MRTGSWPSRAYGATSNRVTPNAHTFPQGQWPLISEQTIREGQHNPIEKHTGRYAIRRYLNVCTRMAHTTCNVRSLVAIGGKADVRVTLFKDRSDPSRKSQSFTGAPKRKARAAVALRPVELFAAMSPVSGKGVGKFQPIPVLQVPGECVNDARRPSRPRCLRPRTNEISTCRLLPASEPCPRARRRPGFVCFM